MEIINIHITLGTCYKIIFNTARKNSISYFSFLNGAKIYFVKRTRLLFIIIK